VRTDAMNFYRLNRVFQQAGYYETAQLKDLLVRMKTQIKHGGLIALSGMIGSGKTVTLRRLREELAKENQVIVCRSLTLQKERVGLDSLMLALHYDLNLNKDYRAPSFSKERWVRELCDLILKKNKPVALFIDEAHDLSRNTLKGLKRLLEVIAEDGGRIAVVLAGHPRLRNEIRQSAMEEIAFRTHFFELDGAIHSRREYIEWLLNECSEQEIEPNQILEPDAIDLLAERLITPLQINQHLTMALEAGHSADECPVSAGTVQSVLSTNLGDWEATLTRLGYDDKSIGTLLEIKPAEIRAFFKGRLDVARAGQIQAQLKAVVGLPVK